MKTLSRALLALTGWIPALAAFEIDLAGTWQFHLPTNAETAPTPDAFTDSIQLPGMLTAQGFGEKPSLTTPWSGGSWTYRDLFPEYQSTEKRELPARPSALRKISLWESFSRASTCCFCEPISAEPPQHRPARHKELRCSERNPERHLPG